MYTSRFSLVNPFSRFDEIIVRKTFVTNWNYYSTQTNNKITSFEIPNAAIKENNVSVSHDKLIWIERSKSGAIFYKQLSFFSWRVKLKTETLRTEKNCAPFERSLRAITSVDGRITVVNLRRKTKRNNNNKGQGPHYLEFICYHGSIMEHLPARIKCRCMGGKAITRHPFRRISWYFTSGTWKVWLGTNNVIYYRDLVVSWSTLFKGTWTKPSLS